MKGTRKATSYSLAVPKLIGIVSETIADVYAALVLFCPNVVRRRDLCRDIETLQSRTNAEGLSFLTKRLPAMGDIFDLRMRGVEVNADDLLAYRSVGVPFSFLRPVWESIPHLRDALLNGTDRAAEAARIVRLVRTVLQGMKKLDTSSLTGAIEGTESAIENFLTIEKELSDLFVDPRDPVIFFGQIMLDRLFEGFDPKDIRPRHGPGAVFGGEKGNQKWSWTTKYTSLHTVYPYFEYHFGVRTAIFDSLTRCRRNIPLYLLRALKHYRSLTEVPEPTNRLLFVPKDSRGPRSIATEPKELMFIQQGLGRRMMKFIERHPLTRGHVNFSSQEINQNLALEASATKGWATIDLKDASDRVSCQLVKLLFPNRITTCLMALRSTAVELPDGSSLPLLKYASMGNALCFPVEALVFWAVAVASIRENTGCDDRALQSVYVYGDDLIVDDAYYGLVVEALTRVGLKVNAHKSFHGDDPFRESCGVEAFNGHDVTPFRVRVAPPMRPSDGNALVAWLAYANNSRPTSSRRSRYCLDLVQGIVGDLPVTALPRAYLSYIDPDKEWDTSLYPSLKWDSDLQVYTSRLLTVKSRQRSDVHPGDSRILADLLIGGEGDPSKVVDRQSTQIRTRRVII